jgi:predicted transposase/invertase (TIGR01784 family)
VKTDSIFYQIFQSFPEIFFELLNLSPNLAQLYCFDSVEVKQLAFRLDGVFLPPATDEENPIYFCEVQFQPDHQFYGRFITEIFLYLSKTPLKNDWRGVVIYPNRRIETSNIERYREILNSGRIERIYLDELGNLDHKTIGIDTIELIVSPQNQAIASTQQLINRIRNGGSEPQKQQNLLQLIETILIYKLPQINRQELETMFSLDELKQTRYFQDVLDEGRQEGRQEGKLDAVPLMLQLGATPEQIAKALNLPIDRILEIQQERSQE